MRFGMAAVAASLALVAAGGLAGAAAPKRHAPPISAGASAAAPTTATVRLLLCGDLMLHRGVKRAAQLRARTDGAGRPQNDGGFLPVLGALRTLTASADVSFCNLESPLVWPSSGDPYGMQTPSSYHFKGPPAVGHALRRVGFTVASMANNHMWNAGPDGVASTYEILEECRVRAVGGGPDRATAHRPVVVERRSVKVAFLAYCSSAFGDGENGGPDEPHVCAASPYTTDNRELAADLARARAAADLTVLSFHWGPAEYAKEPDPRVVAFARWCCDRGADVVAGHHPHVLQRMEPWRAADGRRCLILYSLGNLVSNQSPEYRADDPGRDEDAARRREGAAVVVVAQRRTGGAGRERARIAAVTAVPLWTDSNWRAWTSGEDDLDVRVVPVDEELGRLEARAAFLRERRERIRLQLGLATPPAAAAR